MTILLFVVSYSRINIVRYELSGATYRSRVNRSLRQWQLLQTNGDQLWIFKLHGFIFFGTANNLFERVRERARRAAASPVRFILLDFEQVSGLDSTALLSFRKLLQLVCESKIELIMTGLASRARGQLLRGGFTEQTDGLRLLADMDRGIEWCEDQIVAGVQTELSPEANLRDQLLTILPDASRIAALIQSMHRREVAAGQQIIRQGDEPDSLFFVESGQLTAQLEKPGQEPVRLETMQGGRMVGELGFFLGTPRNASVVADRPSVVYVLTREEWDQITKHHPEVAQTLNSLAIRLLGQRVAHLTRVVDALQY
jgi:SulP family sulfate permease